MLSCDSWLDSFVRNGPLCDSSFWWLQTLTLFLLLTAYQSHQQLQLVLSFGCIQTLTASVSCHSCCPGLSWDLLPRWLQWSPLWPSSLSLSSLWPISTKTSLSQLKSKLDGTTLWIEPLMAFITLRAKPKPRFHLLKPSGSVPANFSDHTYFPYNIWDLDATCRHQACFCLGSKCPLRRSLKNGLIVPGKKSLCQRSLGLYSLAKLLARSSLSALFTGVIPSKHWHTRNDYVFKEITCQLFIEYLNEWMNGHHTSQDMDTFCVQMFSHLWCFNAQLFEIVMS